MTCRIEFAPSAARELGRLDRDARNRIAREIDALAKNPLPPGVEKLQGLADRYPIRVGDYRIVYDFDDDVLRILVLKVGHRCDVYRG